MCLKSLRWFYIVIVVTLFSCDSDSDPDSNAYHSKVKQINYHLFDSSVPGYYDVTTVGYDGRQESSVYLSGQSQINYDYSIPDSIIGIETKTSGSLWTKFKYKLEDNRIVAEEWTDYTESGEISNIWLQNFSYQQERLKTFSSEHNNNVVTYDVVWDSKGQNIIALVGDGIELRYDHDDKFNPFRGTHLYDYFSISTVSYFSRLAQFNKNNIVKFTWHRTSDGLQYEYPLYYRYANNRPVALEVYFTNPETGNEERYKSFSFEY